MNTQLFHDFYKKIQESEKILLINHIRMDGDAWGSLGWLALVLQNMWKQIACINDESVPDSLNFLWNTQLITPELNIQEFNPDIIISLDAASEERLGNTFIKWKDFIHTKTFIVIDHHISNTHFWDINIVENTSSTCELLTHILIETGWEKYITPEAATFLYTGIQTDTNMYATSNTTPNTLRAWAKLIELGANFRLPIDKCFREKTPEQIIAWKIAYNNLKISSDWDISYSCIKEEDILQAWFSIEKMSEYLKGFINETLINISWIKVSFLLYPLKNGEIKWSLRSKDWYDVNTICQKLSGGWHIQAAGFQSEQSFEEIEKFLLKEISQII